MMMIIYYYYYVYTTTAIISTTIIVANTLNLPMIFSKDIPLKLRYDRNQIHITLRRLINIASTDDIGQIFIRLASTARGS